MTSVTQLFILLFSNMSSNMEAELNQAFQLVSQANNHSIKQGEQILALLKKDKSYPLALLHYMNSSNVSIDGKKRASIELKLWCQFFKNLQQYEKHFYGQLLDSIKQSIVHAYLNFPLSISKTLNPGIVFLTEVLFPRDWENLITNLINFSAQNTQYINSVLDLIKEITNKYTQQSRSDILYEQINKVCDQTFDFLKDLTTNAVQIVMSNPNAVSEAIILEVLVKIFYNLNFQDLHPKYEDTLDYWMNVLKAVMKLPNVNQNIFKCKGAALEAILLYSNKYKQDVSQPIKDFCFEIWPLCASASEDTEYDPIVFNCLKFFKTMMVWPEMKPFFMEHMNQFFETLILPNIALNKTAKALFEDQSDVFIDYYFRNTELQTRRAAAIQLLRIICRSYNTFQPFLQNRIQQFMSSQKSDISEEWNLLGLIIDGSSKGFRDIDGCTQLFVNPQVILYCYDNIAKKSLGQIYGWTVQNKGSYIEQRFNIMHMAILIRFLFYFRIYIPREELPSILQFFATLRSQNQSLKKVIYLAINGFLLIKHGDFDNYRNLVPFFNSQNLRPIAFDVFRVIYEGTTSEQFLQDGLTKMFLNISKVLREVNCQFFTYQIQIIKQMLKRTAKYDFNSAQFLFQAIGMLAFYYIQANSKDKVTLQQTVLDFLQVALKAKSDLLNFCLQVIAIFLQLEANTNNKYRVIYEALLLPENWKEENQSVMSSYIQFIISFLSRHRDRLLSDRPPIEVILSKIIEIDHIDLFFRFLDAIMQNTTLQEFSNCGYMQILVQGSQALAHSIQGKKASLLFISKLLVHYSNHIQALNMINNCCSNFYDQLLQASGDILKSVSVRKDRKCIFAAVCKAIESNYFSSPKIEGQILNNLISNTVDRFNMRNISSYVQENQNKQKKEATYRKLQVFKEFQKPELEIQVDEEELLVRTFKQAVGARSQLLNQISQKNKERMMRLNDKYCK